MDEIIEFWYGNPSTEIFKGSFALSSETTGNLCLIDIPTCFTLLDLFPFFELYLPEISELRILKSSTNSIYHCAISLKNSDLSHKFISEHSGKLINSLDNHACTIVNISCWKCDQFESSSPKIHDRCPVCLEDLDSPSISILCGHSFHVKCIEKWGDATCPVCRYYQTPPDISVCDTCGEDSDVRLCLICGELGCHMHSKIHFESTGHTYFQVIETSVTWDYSREVSVERLINSNNKIVELHDSKKIEGIMYEYNILLSCLLSTQKEHYEKKIKEIQESTEDPLVKQFEELKLENEKLIRTIDKETEVVEEIEQLNQEIIRENERKRKLTSENAVLNSKASEKKHFKVTKEVVEEIKELEAQIKEMKFYKATQEKLKNVDIESIEIRKKK